MEYTFDNGNERFVRVRFTGRWPILKESGVVPKILAECRARHRDLLLIDFTGAANQKLSLAERFRLGLSAQSLIELRKIAVVVRPDLLDRRRFGEMVARNRGINIRAFGSLGEATQWLLGDDP